MLIPRSEFSPVCGARNFGCHRDFVFVHTICRRPALSHKSVQPHTWHGHAIQRLCSSPVPSLALSADCRRRWCACSASDNVARFVAQVEQPRVRLSSLMLTSSVRRLRLAVVLMMTSSAASLRVPPAAQAFYTTVPHYTTMAYSTHAGAWRAPTIRMCKAEGEAQSSKAEIAAEIKLVNYQVEWTVMGAARGHNPSRLA